MYENPQHLSSQKNLTLIKQVQEYSKLPCTALSSSSLTMPICQGPPRKPEQRTKKVQSPNYKVILKLPNSGAPGWLSRKSAGTTLVLRAVSSSPTSGKINIKQAVFKNKINLPNSVSPGSRKEPHPGPQTSQCPNLDCLKLNKHVKALRAPGGRLGSR